MASDLELSIVVPTFNESANVRDLLEHLRANGLIQPLPFDPATLRTYSSEDVRSRICSGDPAWRDLVVPEVATLIESRGYFGGGGGNVSTPRAVR